MRIIRLLRIQNMMLVGLAALTFSFGFSAYADGDSVDDSVSEFIQDMVAKHQFSEEQLKALIGIAEKQDSILKNSMSQSTARKKGLNFGKKMRRL